MAQKGSDVRRRVTGRPRIGHSTRQRDRGARSARFKVPPGRRERGAEAARRCLAEGVDGDEISSGFEDGGHDYVRRG